MKDGATFDRARIVLNSGSVATIEKDINFTGLHTGFQILNGSKSTFNGRVDKKALTQDIVKDANHEGTGDFNVSNDFVPT